MAIVQHLIVDEFGSFIAKKSERLRVSCQGELRAEAPLMHLETVLVTGRGVSLSSDVVAACADQGIPIHFLDSRGHPVGSFYSAGLAATVQTRRAQLAALNDTRGVAVAKAFADGKIRNQVNLLNRVLVMDLSRREEGSAAAPIFMANPEIIWESEEISVMEEGCLSIPKQLADVERPAEVRVKYLDYHGKEAELTAEGLLSHCVQHEIDHLNGVLFVDYLSRLKRNMLLKKAEKICKQQVL